MRGEIVIRASVGGTCVVMLVVSIALLFSPLPSWARLTVLGSVGSILGLILVWVTLSQPQQTDDASDEARELFGIIADPWHLDYERRGEFRSEDLTIDEHGRYFIEPDLDQPSCFLKHVRWDPQLRSIHWLKARAPGRSGKPQEESLTLSEDGTKMEGKADYDGHRLIYTRREDQRPLLL